MADETVIFENEAEATRDRIAATIDDLQDRLSPRTIVNNAVGSLSEKGSDALASLRGAVAGHPLALAAAGLAIGVALLARSRIGGARLDYGDSYSAYSDYDDGYAANLADDSGLGRRATLAALTSTAHDAADDNPLAVVIVGVATGALIGSIIPLSATENRLFGDARLRLGAAARAAADAARDEFAAADFSLKGGTAGLADQASHALGAVAQAARDTLGHRPAGGIAG